MTKTKTEPYDFPILFRFNNSICVPTRERKKITCCYSVSNFDIRILEISGDNYRLEVTPQTAKTASVISLTKAQIDKIANTYCSTAFKVSIQDETYVLWHELTPNQFWDYLKGVYDLIPNEIAEYIKYASR